MCGLLALLGETEPALFKRALDLQIHRGPDDSGFESIDGLMLGHRRLSIIDLSHHSSQPMWTNNREMVGVFNGEIYNYLEIKKDLISKGYVFTTQGDTEVLLNAFHCYGEKAVELLIGMFAFVICDRRDNTVFVARDRLGIKPLYYKNTSKGLCFSSEVKSIQSLDSSAGVLDLAAVCAYFSYRYPLTERSFVQDIKQLEPGHLIVIKNGSMTEKSYWDCAQLVEEQENDLGESYYLNRTRELFASAVKYRTIADVPVGAYLSGGVDSSAVVAEMAKSQKDAVKTFTIGFKDDGFNEFEYAREVAKQYQTDHQEILISQDHYFENMEELIRIKDAPLGVPNEVPLFLMSKELKKKVTVVLSGEGADEIFGGYGRLFRSADDYAKLAGSYDNRSESLRSKYGTKQFKSELEHFLHLYRYTSLELKQKLFGPAVNSESLEQELNLKFGNMFDRVKGSCYATKMMYAFEKLHLPGLLQRVDATTMGASVEARVPFVDHRLVEFAFTVPTKYKLRWLSDREACKHLSGDDVSERHDVPKYILKKALEGSLSDRILYRRKMGFPVPLLRFMSGQRLEYVRSRLRDGMLVKQGILDREFLDIFLTDKSLDTHKNAMTAWMAFNLETYFSNHF